MATTIKQTDFFADAETPNRFYLPDKVSFIEHVRLDEGTFQKYQNLTSAVELGQDGTTTKIDMRLGAQRQFLFERLVTGWNLVRIEKDKESKDVEKPIVFTHKKLFELPPHLLTGLIEDIYKKNQILGGVDEDEETEGEEGKEEKS